MTATQRAVVAIFAAGSLFASPARAQRCEPHWSDEFSYGGFELWAEVHAFTIFDPDGPGPEPAGLYAGFEGEMAGGFPALGVARWDGLRWRNLGDGVGDGETTVYTLEVFDEDGDGPALPALFAGGDFLSAGGQEALRVARWDGQAWTPVGGGVSGAEQSRVYALQAVDEDGPGPGDPVLIAGGDFAQAGQTEAAFIARWDGTEWSTLGTGLDKRVAALVVFDDDGDGPHLPALFAGGDFQFAGGKQVNRLAKWNGQAWEKWESGINATVSELVVVDHDGEEPMPPALYVGGSFSQIGGQPFGRIGRWDGQSWFNLDGGVGGGVSAVGSFDLDGDGPQPTCVFVSGSFETAGGVATRNIARWDGTAWSEGDGPFDDYAFAFATFDPDGPGPSGPVLFSGGRLERAGRSFPEDFVAFQDGRWLSPGMGADGNGIRDLLILDDDGDGPNAPALFASGHFGTIAGVPAYGVARWDGQAWTGLNGGLEWTQYVFIESFDPDEDGPAPPVLYASGPYRTENGTPDALARWTGDSWIKVASLQSEAEAMLQFDEDGDGPLPSALFLAGTFYKGVKRWDGQSLTDVGQGLGGDNHSSSAHALTAFDPDGPGPQRALLVAGGDFSAAEGKPAPRVAAWDGSSWSAIGGGIEGSVRALYVLDADGPGAEPLLLYAAGDLLGSGLAQWNGTDWLYKGPGGTCHSILGFDPDGPGPAPTDLYVGGSAHGVSRREGKKWYTVAGGTNGAATALAVYDDGSGPTLFAGGSFTTAGDQSSGHIARLLCPTLTCRADCNPDDTLDLFDFLCFVNLFSAADPAADCDASGALDLFDFLCFVNRFNAGCP